MTIEIFSRVKDGSLNNVSHNTNLCNIQMKYKKHNFVFKVNKLWNNNERTGEIFNEVIEKINNTGVNNEFHHVCSACSADIDQNMMFDPSSFFG